MFDARARVAIFTPEGEIIAGERNGDLARYCRSALDAQYHSVGGIARAR